MAIGKGRRRFGDMVAEGLRERGAVAVTPSLLRHRRGTHDLELDLDGDTSTPSRPSRDTRLAGDVGGERRLHLDGNGAARGGERKGGERGPHCNSDSDDEAVCGAEKENDGSEVESGGKRIRGTDM